MDKLFNNLIHINLCKTVVFIVLKLAWWWLHMNFKNFRYIIIRSRLIIFILHHIKFQCLNNAYMLPFLIPLLTGHCWTWLWLFFSLKRRTRRNDSECLQSRTGCTKFFCLFHIFFHMWGYKENARFRQNSIVLIWIIYMQRRLKIESVSLSSWCLDDCYEFILLPRICHTQKIEKKLCRETITWHKNFTWFGNVAYVHKLALISLYQEEKKNTKVAVIYSFQLHQTLIYIHIH